MSQPNSPGLWHRTVAACRGIGKPWATVLVLAAACLATYTTPALSRWRPWSGKATLATVRSLVTLSGSVRLVEWRDSGGLRLPPGVEATTPRAEALHDEVTTRGLVLAEARWRNASPGQGIVVPARPQARPRLPGREVEDAAGIALSSFYEALWRTRQGLPGAITRIAHFGDSPVTGDLISSGARRRLQASSGDAGHGFLFVDRPWEWYDHQGVELSASGWRKLSPLFRAGNDGHYGLAGVCFVGAPAATTRIATVPSGPGSAVSRFDVYLEARPGGGTVLASLDGAPPVGIPTAADTREGRVHSLAVPDGPHSLELRPAGDGQVVLYGVALERDRPGVVYDSLGTNGGTVHFLTLLDERAWQAQLRLRRPDLVILNYGTNEAGYGYFRFEAYERDIEEVVRRVREALPGVSVLIMSPMDRGTFDETGEIVTLPAIPRIVATQRQVAARLGCGFFDTFSAMGGEGTMGRWYQGHTHLVTGDLTHPTGLGADVVASLLVDALEAGYAQSRGTPAGPPPFLGLPAADAGPAPPPAAASCPAVDPEALEAAPGTAAR